MNGSWPAPDSLLMEFAALISIGERKGYGLPSRPEIRVGDRSWTSGARGSRPARITIDARLLGRAAADRRWVIGHELGHLLPATYRSGTVLQRSLVSSGKAGAAMTILTFLAVAVPAGWASVPDGPAWFRAGGGLFCSLLVAVIGILQRSRDIETACDLASARIYDQVLSEEHVSDLLHREGLNRFLPTVLRTHPRPRRRWAQVQ